MTEAQTAISAAAARVFIDGQAGTTGLEIAERLAGHPQIELIEIEAAARKDAASRARCMAAADITVLCLPDAAVPEALKLAGAGRVLDASSVNRTADGWAYGLPELDPALRQALGSAVLAANPGCYPQGFLLLLRPLLDAGWVQRELPLCLHALSGFSGGGRPLIDRYRAETATGEPAAPRSYALDGGHKHLAEMQRFSGLNTAPVFNPIVGSYHQGMLVQVPLHRSQLAGAGAAAADPRGAIEALLTVRYAAEPLVGVRPLDAGDPRQNGFLDPEALNETDRIELMVFGDHQHLTLAARYDNLGKGAAGAAVQNLNLMLGLKETTALRL
ncbi:MAG: N-acetyl-gamma-glutamyl-phosphate reductase [Pseudomonadota bacterium]